VQFLTGNMLLHGQVTRPRRPRQHPLRHAVLLRHLSRRVRTHLCSRSSSLPEPPGWATHGDVQAGPSECGSNFSSLSTQCKAHPAGSPPILASPIQNRR
jgi:hypothetical protein